MINETRNTIITREIFVTPANILSVESGYTIQVTTYNIKYKNDLSKKLYACIIFIYNMTLVFVLPLHRFKPQA